MAFHSHKQARFAHASPHVFGGKTSVTAHADATDFNHLPESAGDAPVSKPRPTFADDPIDSQLAEPDDPTRHVNTKPGPGKYSPTDSLHRLVNQLAKGGR